MPIALVRDVSPAMARCELTHLARTPIDIERATAQHADYARHLGELGCEVVTVAAAPALPDSVFIEDTAIVLDELAVITRPGAASRRPEVDAVASVLGNYRPLAHIGGTGTIDGGDVLRLGRTIYVGRSSRTNDDAIGQLRALVAGYGYVVEAVEVSGCLHLKTAATGLPGDAVLLNPTWIDARVFGDRPIHRVDPAEPFGANVVTVGGAVLSARAYSRTAAALAASGFAVSGVDVSELAKAEGALTCCSILLDNA